MVTSKIIQQFLSNRSWMGKAKKLLTDKKELLNLLVVFKDYLHKEQLVEAKDNLSEVLNYVKDVATGKYTSYNSLALVKIVALILYVVSPFDIIPDFFSVIGFTDDLTIVAYVIKSLNDELGNYRKNKYIREEGE